MKRKLPLLVALIYFSVGGYSQNISNIVPIHNDNLSKQETLLDSLFKNNTDVDFYFKVKSKAEVDTFLTNIISIDAFNSNTLIGQAGAPKEQFREFLKLNIPYWIIPRTPTKAITMASTTAQMASWDRYPYYSVYDQMMTDFQTNYPTLFKRYDLLTLPSGNKIIAGKLTSNVTTNAAKPRYLWMSSVHGDETTGFVTLLRYINYLLSNYGTITQVTNIVDNIELWIIPDFNPDGTYYNSSGGTTVANARRNNAEIYDMNRNSPDPTSGQHPDGFGTQIENKTLMEFQDTMNFNGASMFHGGSDVWNFPWDYTVSGPLNHADDAWWRLTGLEFAASCQTLGPANGIANYFKGTYPNGISEGGDWYVIHGGQQDYMNWYAHCRYVTIEISMTKMVGSELLPSYWNSLYPSMLRWNEQLLFGFRGTITDACTGQPLKAKIFVNSHDKDSSWVYSRADLGNYYRPIAAGTWSVTFSATGYTSQTISVTTTDGAATLQNVALVPLVTSPTANFTASLTSITSGSVPITFTNSSTNAIAYLWDFGDGTTSTTINPTHTYVNNGTYTVTLTAKQGCNSNVMTRSSYINVTLPAGPTTTGGSNCFGGTVALSASAASGWLNWYTTYSGTKPFNTGTSYTTPSLVSTTNYYVENWVPGATVAVGEANSTGSAKITVAQTSTYMSFTTSQPTRIVSVDIYAGKLDTVIVLLYNSSGQLLNTKKQILTFGAAPTLNTVTLNFDVPVGSYRLSVDQGKSVSLYYKTAATAYPYTNAPVSITGGSPTAATYYFLYNWKVQACTVSERSQVTATIYPYPVITGQPANPAAVCDNTGSSAFTVTATGTSLSYQWQEYTSGWASLTDNSMYSGVTTSSLTITKPTFSMNGYKYRCIVTGIGSCATNTNGNATLTVTPSLPASVSIAAVPAGAICVGTSVVFTATPTNGGTTPAYQWKKNGSNVGTNSVTYTDATLVNGDLITCVMTSNATPCLTGSPATSNTITQVVGPPLTVSVSIAANPGTSICSGTSIIFTATPTNGGVTPAYQWKKNNVNVGSNSTTYTDAGLANGDQIICILTSSLSCVNGNPATSNLLTMSVTSAPNITGQPASPAAVCAGTGSPTFTVSATGAGLTYQWQRGITGVYTDITGGTTPNDGCTYSNYTTATLTVTNPSAGMTGYTYRCVVSGTCTPAATSNGLATLTVNSPPNITGQPGNQTVTAGTNTATFTVTATGGTSYQWQRGISGVYTDITGASAPSDGCTYSNYTTATLTVTNAPIGMNGYTYRCVVTGTCPPASTTDGLATLTVTSGTTYYTWANGAPETFANWWTNNNGTGSHPLNFTTAGCVYIIQNNNTMTTVAAWTVTNGGIVMINNGCTLTATAAAVTCGGLTINSGGTLTTSRILTVNGTTNITGRINLQTTARVNVFAGDIILNSGAVWNETVANTPTISGSLTNNATTFTASTGLYTFSGTGKTLSGTKTSIPNAAITGTYTNNGIFTVGTALSGAGGLTNDATGVLNIGGTVTVTTLTATAVGNTVNYTGAAQAACKVTTYHHLTLSGSGAKTFATTPTVNGVLSLEGTASIAVSSGVVTYGTNATLQYNKTGSYTATSKEWISPFLATGGIIIKNTGAITTPGAVQIGSNTSVPLNINNGATLTPGSNPITLHGDFINAGTLTSGSGGITIDGTVSNQYIDGFTTTGTVSCTKTSGTATLDGGVTSGPLTVSGVGGTLNLGASLAHSCTNLTVSGGTFDGSSSTLSISGTVTTGGTFTANAGTINYNGGAQVLAGWTYNNLTLSGSGAKTLTGATVNGILSMEGTATTTGSSPTYGGSSTLQYKGSSAQTTTAVELPATFNGSLVIDNALGVALNNTTTVGGTLLIKPSAIFTVNSNMDLTVTGATTLNGSAECFIIKTEGSFIDHGISGSGTARVEKLLATTGRYWYIGSPVSNGFTYAFGTLSGTANQGTRLFSWNEPLQRYDYYTLGTEPLTVGTGYTVKKNDAGDLTAVFIGNLNTANSVPVAISNLTYTSGKAKAGFNLVCNPFPSAIDINVFGPLSTNLYNVIWFSKNGTFPTWNWVSHLNTLSATKDIPAMQAFWVLANGATGNLQLTNASGLRLHSAQSFWKKSPDSNVFRIEVSRDSLMDEAVVAFFPSAEFVFDPFDSQKMFASNISCPQIFTQTTDSTEVAINGQPELVEGVERVVPLAFMTNVAGTFTLKATSMTVLDPNISVILEDSQLGNFQELYSNNSYTFTSGIVNDNARFKLHFNIISTGIASVSENSVFLYGVGNNVYVSTPDNSIVEIFNILGEKIVQKQLNKGFNKIQLNVSKGIYIVNVLTGSDKVSKKVYLGY